MDSVIPPTSTWGQNSVNRDYFAPETFSSMERREIERTRCSKRLPENRQMNDRVLLVDILPYSLVIPATNQCKFTLDHDKPFSLFHKVKHSNVNISVLCAFTISFTKCNERICRTNKFWTLCSQRCFDFCMFEF